jgi:hypothetical protein
MEQGEPLTPPSIRSNNPPRNPPYFERNTQKENQFFSTLQPNPVRVLTLTGFVYLTFKKPETILAVIK